MANGEIIELADEGVLIAAPAESSGLALFVPPVDADSLVDAFVAGQLSRRTRLAYASDLFEFLSALDVWGLRLDDVTRDHLNAYRS